MPLLASCSYRVPDLNRLNINKGTEGGGSMIVGGRLSWPYNS